ncbi:DPP IV N-terminal domain-containing protein [Alteromonas sp. 5E99-2]|uniref:S9 family peptidase n=1 Tax=Alteromonas sp. 5E99-2 TaxID=2817683 RepID=UPI001A999FE5|nr:S9 family peptidase [Alteromonas sp. 5E99-2]MBO1254795.1 DPP IV N-terminal domain-containing protein [Alteromonas sp. 5E99-2]
MKTVFSIILMACISNVSWSHEHKDALSIERIFESPSLDGTAPRMLRLSPDSKRVTFLKGKDTDYERFDLWEYNVESGKTQLLVDSDSLSSGSENLSDEEKARRERMRLSGSGIVSYTWSKDGTEILFPLAGDAYLYTLATAKSPAKVTRLLNTPEFETDIRLSPKGQYIGFIRNQNLFIKDIETNKETAITQKGGGLIKFGMAEFVAQEEMSRLTGYWFAPDESSIAFTRVDETPVDIITRSEIYADTIKTIEQRYPRAGTGNAKVALFVQSIESTVRTEVPLKHGLSQNNDIYFARGKWASNTQFSFQIQTRNQQELALNLFDTTTNTTTNVLTETSNTWVNLHDSLRFINDGKQFIWASERSGFNHLYLFNIDGSLQNSITQGDWVVTSLDAVNEDANTVYFSGRKDTPIENHLYAASLNGKSVKRITQRSGFHNTVFSRNGGVYIDSFSTINSPSQVSLHKASGSRLTWLEENKIDENHPLHKYQNNWVKPTFGTISADNGDDLHYRLYTPKVIKDKHPAIVFVYGGPHAQMVTNRWAGRRGLLLQHWVDKGYVVFTLDNRGSNFRGKAFEDPIYKKMGEIEVKDQVLGAEFLASLPYVDKDRIGIHGHSYGGYMTLMTMFKAGDYFAAGVSGAPVTDWRLYDTHYTERYMGNPTTEDNAYTQSSVFPYAKDLKGDLLIYHGMADDNVLFTHSTKLYKHLQDNAKPFESMDYPGKKHSIRGKQTGVHLYHTITNFFDRTLNP